MSAPRHYEVVSPEVRFSSYGGDYGPPEYGPCWGLYLARNAKDAIRQAVADEAFREWVDEQRASRQPPFKGLKATLTLCEHGACWGCATPDSSGCATCDAKAEADDASRLASLGQPSEATE